MLRTLPTILFLLFLFASRAQNTALPVDLRQHNLTEYNASLLHPAFSLTLNNPQSVALWSRWQWQSIDADPTTLFLNYTRQLNANSVAGAAFFQHNTGTFLNTGGVLNYGYKMEFDERASLAFGVNLFGFKQQLSDDRFRPDPQIQLPQLVITDDFILQLAPGFLFSYDRLSVGFASENLFDYNFTTNKRNSRPDDRIYLGMASYDFPISLFNFQETVLRPTVYVKSVPNNDTQIGIVSLLSTEKFWAQAGYNSFYGISFGGGGRFFKKFSIGALMEFGTSSSLKGRDPTFEFVTAYNFGTPDMRKKVVGFDEEGEVALEEELTKDEQLAEELAKKEAEAQQIAEQEKERLRKEQEKITRDSLDLVKKNAEALAKTREKEQQRKLDSIAQVSETKAIAEKEQMEQQRRQDSIKKAQEAAVAAAQQMEQQRRQDSIKKAQEAEAVVAQQLEQQRKKDSIAKVKEAQALAQQQRVQDSIAEAQKEALAEAERLKAKREIDSLTKVRMAEAEAAKKAEEEKVVEEEVVQENPADKPQAGEKYEEVNTEDGLEPGYYLITNVFGTKKYFDAFMKDLTSRGLEPKSFFRSLNQYNYVYLKRYDTMTEARAARDSKYDGRYPDKTWIFRVVSK